MRTSSERGAVAVEAALVLPILILLAVGIVEFTLTIRDWLAVSSAVRAGARVASAEPRHSATNPYQYAEDAAAQVAISVQDLIPTQVKELWVYRAGPSGMPDSGSFTSCATCVKFTWNSTRRAFTRSGAGWKASTQHSCAGDSDHDWVGVYLRVRHDAATKLFFSALNIREKAVMALEPDPAECY